ncbi:MAG: aminopeptidase P family protein [Nitrospinota bacterium]|nr:MAG: aminopeptidase P family protein [Nitrospinota bacterium]
MPRVPFDLEARKPYLIPVFSDTEYDRRVTALCTAMAQEGLDALCIYANATSPSAVAYLTNYAPLFGSAFVVLRANGTMTLVTDSVLHGEPMHSMIWMCRIPDVRVALGPVYGGTADEVALLTAALLRGARRVGLTGQMSLPHPLYAALASRVPTLYPADHLLAAVRLYKSDEEIAKMREAGRIADAAYAAVFDTLAVGIEETAVAAAAVHRIHTLGAREAFATCVVGGVQAGLKHGQPRRRPLVEGEMVFIDLGAAVDGYMSDCSRCTVVGPARGEARELLHIGLELYEAGLQVMGPGRTIDEIAQALLKVVQGTRYAAYFCPTGFGHGIGMTLLESPGLFAGNPTELRPRMTVAYEPMVVVEGLGTGVVEDTLLITETGYERLTQYPVVTWE